MSEMNARVNLDELAKEHFSNAVQIAKLNKKIGSKPTRIFLNSQTLFNVVSYVSEVNKTEKLMARLRVSDKVLPKEKSENCFDRIYDVLNGECLRLLDLRKFLWNIKNATKENPSYVLEAISSRESMQNDFFTSLSNLIMEVTEKKNELGEQEKELINSYSLFLGQLQEKNGRVNGLYYTARTFEGDFIKNLIFLLEDEGRSVYKAFQTPDFLEYLKSVFSVDAPITREDLMDRIVVLINSSLFEGFVKLLEINSEGVSNNE